MCLFCEEPSSTDKGTTSEPKGKTSPYHRPQPSNDLAAKVPRDQQSGEGTTQRCFIRVTGMTCASCVANIERSLLKHKGV